MAKGRPKDERCDDSEFTKKKLRDCRKGFRWSQEKFGEKTGYSKDTISRMERGIIKLTYIHLSQFIEKLGLDKKFFDKPESIINPLSASTPDFSGKNSSDVHACHMTKLSSPDKEMYLRDTGVVSGTQLYPWFYEKVEEETEYNFDLNEQQNSSIETNTKNENKIIANVTSIQQKTELDGTEDPEELKSIAIISFSKKNDELAIKAFDELSKTGDKRYNHVARGKHGTALWRSAAYDDAIGKKEKIERFKNAIDILKKALKYANPISKAKTFYSMSKADYYLWKFSNYKSYLIKAHENATKSCNYVTKALENATQTKKSKRINKKDYAYHGTWLNWLDKELSESKHDSIKEHQIDDYSR